LPNPWGEPSVRRAALLGFGILAAVLVSGCGLGRPDQGKKRPPAEVVVTTPVSAEITDYQDFTGRLDALKTVDVRPRVSGYVQSAPFKEGDLVREGDLLFQIDPRTYQAEYHQAEANLKQAEADRKLLEKNVARARKMIAGNAIGKEEYDQISANWEKSGATVAAMEAARDRAKLYLDFTRVVAPLSGRISRRQVDPGNLVNADNTVLTTIVTVDPVYAYFDVDERTYLNLVEASRHGKDAWFSELKYPVMMRLANEETFSHVGTVNFLDNRVSGNTGTIRMRGVFENTTGILKPGLFVRIRLPIGTPYKAFVIPDEAVQSDQGRKYVYVVAKDDTVVYRPVTLGQEMQKLRVIKEGLAEGERVIKRGMQRVKPNVKVEVKMEPPPTAPESPLSKLLADYHPTPVPAEAEATRGRGDAETRRHADAEKKRRAGQAHNGD
jgi:RND family efflux transporter MFP subunit